MKPTPLLIALGIFTILAGFVYYTAKNPPQVEDDRQPILRADEDKVRRITISRPEHDTITLERGDDGVWLFGEPLAELRADESTASLMATNLAELSADRIVEENVTDWTPYGLQDAGAVQVALEVDDGDDYTVVFGNDTPTGSGVYARLEGDPRLFTVFSYVKSSFEKEVFDLRDKKLLRVDNETVSRMVLRADGGTIEFGKTGDNAWQILKPGPLRADNFTVGDLLRSARDAEMVTVPAETEKPSGRYSFRPPYASVEISDESGTHTITVAKTRGDDEKYYAKSSDVDGVFEVSAIMAEGLNKKVEDFRNKKLFDFGFKEIASLDVRDGDTRLTIAKEEDTWKLTSDEDRELDSTKVQVLIDKLRNLTATAYPSDRAADQAGYGLTEPAIEAKVTTAEDGTDDVLVSDPGQDQVYATRRGQPSSYEVDRTTVEQIQSAIADVLKPAEEEPAESDEDTE